MLAQGIGGESQLGQSDGAQRERIDQLDAVTGGADQLQAPTPNVGHQHRAGVGKAVGGGAIGEVGLVFRGNDPQGDSFSARAVDEFSPVASLPNGGSGDSLDAVGTGLTSELE